MTERRHTTWGEGITPREKTIRQLHAHLNPQLIKGVSLTDVEREILLARVEEIRAEIENAPVYQGAL